MRGETLKVLLVVLLVCSIALLAGITASGPVPPGSAVTTTHGLRGHYYTRSLPGSYDLKGFLVDAYNIPTGNKAPDAIRIDPQLAFGRGKGFDLDSEHDFRNTKGGVVWWEPKGAGAVVWKGYVRLPKAGTYYIITASHGSSAVYVNGARVGLNGGFGGSIPSPAFSYDDPTVPAPYKPTHGQYAVPIVAATPRVLPMEVGYHVKGYRGKGPGIDLYWVTPDSARDAKGKAIASIVPSEALFVEPPEPGYQSTVSGPHSTMSSDMLYLPNEGDEVATLTIRVADKQGRPVAGKQVVVSSLQSHGSGTDTVVQPTIPTNAQGITTAQFKTSGAVHTSHLFATVVDEAVDVGQEVEIIGQRGQLAFLPLTFSPYYGGKHFLVTPTPMRVGQTTTITVPLMNRKKEPYELTVKVLANPPNIGMFNWTEVGRTETFVLKPGESREVKVTWIPTEAAGHLCFKIEVWGRPASARTANREGLSLISTALAQEPIPVPHPTPPYKLMDSRQQNIGPVSEMGEGNRFHKLFGSGGPWDQIGDWEAAEELKARGIPPLPRILDEHGKPTRIVKDPKTGKDMLYYRQKGPDGEYLFPRRSAPWDVLLSKKIQRVVEYMASKDDISSTTRAATFGGHKD